MIYGVVGSGSKELLLIDGHRTQPWPWWLVTSVPNYVSEEQHQALVSSTPSFSDIPSILLYHEENISVVLDPPLQGFPEEDAATRTLYLLSS